CDHAEPGWKQASQRVGDEDFALAKELPAPFQQRKSLRRLNVGARIQDGCPRQQSQHQKHRRKRPLRLSQREDEGDACRPDEFHDVFEVRRRASSGWHASDCAADHVQDPAERDQCQAEEIGPTSDGRESRNCGHIARGSESLGAQAKGGDPARGACQNWRCVTAYKRIEHGAEGIRIRAHSVKPRNFGIRTSYSTNRKIFPASSRTVTVKSPVELYPPECESSG